MCESYRHLIQVQHADNKVNCHAQVFTLTSHTNLATNRQPDRL